MVAVAQAVNVRTIDPENFQLPRRFVQLAEIEVEIENLVKELVLLGPQPPVEDVALVETRVHRQGSSPQTACAHCTAEAKASSWKP